MGRLVGMRMSVRRSAAAIVVLVLAVGTSAVACDPASAPFSGERCEGVPFDACQSAIDEAAAVAAERGAIIVGVRVRCTAAACTPQQGEIAVQAWFSNGSEFETAGGYATPVGPPPGGPAGSPTPIPLEPTCAGVPRSWCLEQAAEVLRDAGGRAPRSILVTCAAVACSETGGRGVAVVTWEDGTQSEIGFEYEGALPEPIPVASPTASSSPSPTASSSPSPTASP